MTIFKAGQVVKLRSGKIGTIRQAHTGAIGTMANHEWYFVSLESDNNNVTPTYIRVPGIDILNVEVDTASQRIKSLAKQRRTTGTWFSWGPTNFNQLWISACTNARILEHALQIPKANDNLWGAGLYIASEFWRSATYAADGGSVLIVHMADIPTIDSSSLPGNQADILQAGSPVIDINTVKREKLNATFSAKYLHIFGSGAFGCLTASKGVKCTLDLGTVKTDVLKSNARKLGIAAKRPFLEQVTNLSPTMDEATRRDLLNMVKLE